ncbi:MAG TPA: hypothetical protein VN031_00910 [Candidatus Microsaccharimonas sp.]|nr:hypothetical protein [Candidatus Microsaccharimonas sp.]
MTRPEGLDVLELRTDQVRSIARVTICGVNRPVRNRICNLTYEVICGEGIMAVEGELHELRPGVVVDVPAGQAYQDAGEVSFIVTSEPPFCPEQVEIAEPQLPVSLSYQLQ